MYIPINGTSVKLMADKFDPNKSKTNVFTF